MEKWKPERVRGRGNRGTEAAQAGPSYITKTPVQNPAPRGLLKMSLYRGWKGEQSRDKWTGRMERGGWCRRLQTVQYHHNKWLFIKLAQFIQGDRSVARGRKNGHIRSILSVWRWALTVSHHVSSQRLITCYLDTSMNSEMIPLLSIHWWAALIQSVGSSN